MSFVEDRPPSATVKALASSVVLSIPRVQLAAKLKQDTAFAARFYRALAVFLSFRLRKTVSQLGYGKSSPTEEEKEASDELDANVLDNVYLAGLIRQDGETVDGQLKKESLAPGRPNSSRHAFLRENRIGGARGQKPAPYSVQEHTDRPLKASSATRILGHSEPHAPALRVMKPSLWRN